MTDPSQPIPDEAPPTLPAELAQVVPALPEPSVEGRVLLSSGDALSSLEARRLTAERRSRVVVVAGMPRSGKTTLLAGIYERFLRGHFAGYKFRGSATLREFEAIAFLARNASHGTAADTGRTPNAESRFLHLELTQDDPSSASMDVLFSDLWGEAFRLAKTDAESARPHTVVARADHFVLLVDGDQLLAHDTRHAAALDAFSILRQYQSMGYVGRHTMLDVIVTKWDRLVARLGTAIAVERSDAAKEVVLPLFAACASATWHTLSIRDDDGELSPEPRALEDLLRKWISTVAAPKLTVVEPMPGSHALSPYLRFGVQG